MAPLKSEIAVVAARWVVEEGLEYAQAKRRALKQLGLPARTAWPDNARLQAEVASYIALFCGDRQPQELCALRRLALLWMQRMALFRPYLVGTVWHGTATRKSCIYLQLFCDDCKSAEIALINAGIAYKPSTVRGFRGEPVEALTLAVPCAALAQVVGVHLMVYDVDDLRGALKPDALGRVARGSAAAVQALLDTCGHD